MKRTDLLAATLVGAMALGIGPALRGADPVPTCSACTAKVADKTKTVKATKEHVVGELVTILNETKSPDTFVVTVSCLGMMGHDARMAVPSIIRNAERLGLLKEVSEFAWEESCEDAKPGKQQRIAEGIMDCLDQILSRQPGIGGKAAYQPNLPPPSPLVCPPSGLVLPQSFPIPVCAPPPAPPADKTPFGFFIGVTR
jgi:hypothetical protein